MLRMVSVVAMLTCLAFTLGAQTANAPAGSSSQSQSVQPTPPQRVRVAGSVMLGMVDHKTMPVYPDDAMTKGIQGDVLFQIEIDKTGKIEKSLALQGDPLLVAAGADALRTNHFRPYLLDGAPVAVETELGYHFSVEKTSNGVNGHVECITSASPQAR